MQRWVNARDRGLTILIWLTLVGVVFWLLSYMVSTLLLLALAAVFAYALSPLVNFLDRRLPRWLAIVLVYVIALGILGGMLFLVLDTLITQIVALKDQLPELLRQGTPRPSLFLCATAQAAGRDRRSGQYHPRAGAGLGAKQRRAD
jgi:predicted PurR-regulated permease PerM